MSKADGVFIYIGTYASEVDARADYDVVKDLHAVGAVGTYDAAVITKDDKGKIHVNKDETTTRHGAWGGAAAGALVGILFPPSIIGTAHRRGRHRRRERPPVEGHVPHRRQGVRRGHRRRRGGTRHRGRDDDRGRHREGAAEGAEEGGQGAPGRQDGRRQGGAGRGRRRSPDPGPAWVVTPRTAGPRP